LFVCYHKQVSKFILYIIYLHLIYFKYHFIILSYYHIIILWYYHIIILSYHLIIILSYYHIIILSYYHIIISSYYHIIIFIDNTWVRLWATQSAYKRWRWLSIDINIISFYFKINSKLTIFSLIFLTIISLVNLYSTSFQFLFQFCNS